MIPHSRILYVWPGILELRSTIPVSCVSSEASIGGNGNGPYLSLLASFRPTGSWTIGAAETFDPGTDLLGIGENSNSSCYVHQVQDSYHQAHPTAASFGSRSSRPMGPLDGPAHWPGTTASCACSVEGHPPAWSLNRFTHHYLLKPLPQRRSHSCKAIEVDSFGLFGACPGICPEGSNQETSEQ
jgi:hypothetical protein